MVERAPYFADLIYMQKEKTVNTKHIGATLLGNELVDKWIVSLVG